MKKYLNEEDQKTFALVQELRNKEVTREELVAREIARFDWSYDYSDYAPTWRAGQAQEKKLFELLDKEYPDPTDARWRLLKGLKKNAESQAEFREHYPRLRVEHLLNDNRPRYGLLGCALDGVSDEIVERTLNFIKTYKEEILPHLPYSWHENYRFIKTKAAPTAEFLRKNGHKTLAVFEGAQAKIFQLFDNPNAGEVLALIEKYHLTEGLNFNFDEIFGTPYAYVRIAAYMEEPWKSYQYFYRKH